MKNAKKVLAMVIVLALAISMAIPASANFDGKITIENAKEGVTYSAWKMADLSFDATTNAYRYTVAENWADFFTGDGKDYFVVTNYNGQQVVTAKENLSDADMAEAAKLAVKYAEDLTATASGVADDSGDVELTVTPGYYCVNSNLGVICSLGTADDGENEVTIKEKNDIPTITKTVEDGKAANDASFGDIIEFVITVTKQAGAENYKVVDTLSDGLDYYTDDVHKLSYKNIAAEKVDFVQNGRELTFTFDNETVLALADATEIEITYYAKVNQSAVIDGANPNTAYLEYGENSDFTTEEVVTNTYVWSFDIFKYREVKTGDETVKTALQGAGFTLYNAEGKALKFDKVNGIYKYAGVAADGETGTEITANEDGKYFVDGLDSATYKVVETTVPNGFNKADDIFVVIGETDMAKTISVGKAADNVALITGDVVEILNSTGTVLPSTGGTGTVIFVVVGSFLVLAMGVLLVVRKRMSKVVYTR